MFAFSKAATPSFTATVLISQSNTTSSESFKPMTNHRPTFLLALTVLVLATSGAALSQSELVLNPDTTDPLLIPLFSDSTLKIDPETGAVEVTSADTSNLGGTAEVAVDAFTPVPGTVEQGKSFMVSLGSRGAWQCSRSGDLPDGEWQESDSLRNGTVSVTVDPSIEPKSSYTLRFECENAGVSDFATALLEVVPAPEPDPTLPAGCDDLPLPTDWTRDTSVIPGDTITTTKTWFDVFELPFPQANGKNLAHNRDQYMSLEFDPSDLPADAEGTITFNTVSTSIPPGIGNGTPTVAISRCPGDFRPQADSACRRIDANSIIWSTALDTAEPGCQIDVSESRYFLNVVYALEFFGPDDPSTWFYNCPDGQDECGSLVSSFSN